jgi:anti-anti-sigma regulatory factor
MYAATSGVATMASQTVEVLRPGEVTSVGFKGKAFLGESLVPALRDELMALVEEEHPKVLQFDLTGITLLTSDVLNFFVWLHNRDVEIVLFNPSDHVRQVLEITKLDSIFAVVEPEESGDDKQRQT